MWVKKLHRRRRARQLAGRIQDMDGIIDENPLLNNGDLEQAEAGDFDGDNDAALEADGV